MEISISALDVPKGIHYEGMTYYQEKNQLIWVDIMGQSLMIYDRASGQYEKQSLSCPIGFAIPWDERRLLCGLATGLAFFHQIDLLRKEFGLLDPC